MNERSLPLGGGPRAWKVRAGGKSYWVGRSKRSRILKGLYSTEAEALGAGDDLDKYLDDLDFYAKKDEILNSKYFDVFIVETAKEEAFIALYDEIEDNFHEFVYPHTPHDHQSIRDLQEKINLIDAQTTSHKDHVPSAPSEPWTP